MYNALMNTKSTVISLFSGAGGFSYGFSLAGLKPEFGVEINADACESYQINLGKPCHQLDLGCIDPVKIHNLINNISPFIIIGGPPCQGFSTAGARNTSDPRNMLIFNYLAIVEKLSPNWFVFENVEGILTSNQGLDLTNLVREFIKIGYSIKLQKVNFAAYGVPQTRKRVLIIGNKFGIDFSFPEENFSFDSGKSKKYSNNPMAPSLNFALSGLGYPSSNKREYTNYQTSSPTNWFDALMRSDNTSQKLTQHFTTQPHDLKMLELLQPGQTMKDLPAEFWHDSFKRRANRRVLDGIPSEKRGGAPSGVKRLHGHMQSLTITGAASREFIHPTENRSLTLRECARLQSFPDKYQWTGNSASVMQQIGNAVPPLAAESIATHISNIEGSFGSGLQAKKQNGKPRLLGFLLTEASGMSPALKTTHTKLSNIMEDQQELCFE